jgi:hypothetical protein
MNCLTTIRAPRSAWRAPKIPRAANPLWNGGLVTGKLAWRNINTEPAKARRATRRSTRKYAKQMGSMAHHGACLRKPHTSGGTRAIRIVDKRTRICGRPIQLLIYGKVKHKVDEKTVAELYDLGYFKDIILE